MRTRYSRPAPRRPVRRQVVKFDPFRAAARLIVLFVILGVMVAVGYGAKRIYTSLLNRTPAIEEVEETAVKAVSPPADDMERLDNEERINFKNLCLVWAERTARLSGDAEAIQIAEFLKENTSTVKPSKSGGIVLLEPEKLIQFAPIFLGDNLSTDHWSETERSLKGGFTLGCFLVTGDIITGDIKRISTLDQSLYKFDPTLSGLSVIHEGKHAADFLYYKERGLYQEYEDNTELGALELEIRVLRAIGGPPYLAVVQKEKQRIREYRASRKNKHVFPPKIYPDEYVELFQQAFGSRIADWKSQAGLLRHWQDACLIIIEESYPREEWLPLKKGFVWQINH